MTKFRFRVGDVVREKGKENGVTGEVIGFGRGQGTDWYKIESRGEVYNARDDELELARRRVDASDPNLVEYSSLLWFRPEHKPYRGELCLLCLEHDPDDAWTARFDGEVWQTEIAEGCAAPIEPSIVRCWASYSPPTLSGEEDESWADGCGQAFSPDAED